MDKCIEISSDSDDDKTIILPPNESTYFGAIETLLNKYSNDIPNLPDSPQNKFYDLSASSDEELIQPPLIKRLKCVENRIRKSLDQSCWDTESLSNSIERTSGCDNQLLKQLHQKYLPGTRTNSQDDQNTDIVHIQKMGCELSKEVMDLMEKPLLINFNAEQGPLQPKGSIRPTSSQKKDVLFMSDFDASDEEYLNPLVDRHSSLLVNELNKGNEKKGETLNFSSSSNEDLLLKTGNANMDDINLNLEKFSPKEAARMKKSYETARRKKEREAKNEKKALEKRNRVLQKQQKIELLQKEKEIKKAIKTVQKSVNPNECIKHIIVKIGSDILEDIYGDVLKDTLNTNKISFDSTTQVVPNLLTWTRRVQSIENMVLKEVFSDEESCLVIMKSKEFFTKIKDDDLSFHIQNIQKTTKKKQVTLAVLGTERITSEHQMALVELELLTKCYVRTVMTAKDLAAFVMELTKSVAQIPYKSQMAEKNQVQTEYFNGCNKDCVAVDKNGNGLGRLWQQMLTMFPLVRLESAEAITSAYPTLSSLFKAYDNCQSKKEALLQELPVRRANGPFSQSRRIGPELSRKCFNFFCSEDNVFL